MLRLIQNLLLAVGATSTAAALAAGCACLVGLLIFPTGRDAGGAVVAFVALALGGGVLGAITGLIGSLRWIARQPPAVWTLGTWMGVLVGLAAGLAIRLSAVLEGNVLGDVVAWLPGTFIFHAAMAFWGGCLGGISMAWLQGRLSGPSQAEPTEF